MVTVGVSLLVFVTSLVVEALSFWLFLDAVIDRPALRWANG